MLTMLRFVGFLFHVHFTIWSTAKVHFVWHWSIHTFNDKIDHSVFNISML